MALYHMSPYLLPFDVVKISCHSKQQKVVKLPKNQLRKYVKSRQEWGVDCTLGELERMRIGVGLAQDQFMEPYPDDHNLRQMTVEKEGRDGLSKSKNT